ncbi:MAG: hypothetical protein GXY33_11085 [Phycisphaerae bacterium]|nr:hypothetical protein [Phycisphaerae bacterium]
MAKTVFGIAASHDQAQAILIRLREAGLPPDDVSVIVPDDRRGKVGYEDGARSEPGVAGAGAGAALGSVLGWLAGVGALVIPGLGPFVAAGPIMAALGGAAMGAAVGGLVGALVGMGLPEEQARAYEARVKEGDVLLSIRAASDAEAAKAAEILELNDAADVVTVSDTPV